MGGDETFRELSNLFILVFVMQLKWQSSIRRFRQIWLYNGYCLDILSILHTFGYMFEEPIKEIWSKKNSPKKKYFPNLPSQQPKKSTYF